MSDLFNVFIDASAKPTVEGYNALTKNILPKGIYSGGEVTQGPGRSVTVAPFTLKALDGFTVEGQQQNLVIASPNEGDWAVVLYCKSWVPGDLEKKHKVEFRILPWSKVGNTKGYSDVLDPDEDRPLYILFARVRSRQITGGTNVRIDPTDIDSSFAERIFINQPSTQVLSGEENFGGPLGVKVFHNLGHLNYRAQVTPSETPNVGLGDIWTEKYATYFMVKCNGEVTTKFDWSLFVTLNKFGLTPQAIYGSRVGNAILRSVESSIIRHSEDSHNYGMIAAPIGQTAVPFVGCNTQFYLATLSTSVVDPVSVAWQLISANVKKDIVVYDDTLINGGAAQIPLTLDVNLTRAFMYPKASYSLVDPLINVQPTGVEISAICPDGSGMLVLIFKNPNAYMNGRCVSVLNSIEVQHNLDFPSYVPLIAFKRLYSGSLTGYSLEIKPNSFKIYLPLGVRADLDWLIVPSFA